MIDLEKINEMISLIENGQIPDNVTNNEFFLNFYNNVKLVPLSKYLRSTNRAQRLPKIMYARKAGELISNSQNNEEILGYLKRNGYDTLPELDYRSILLLRKINDLDNWKKILVYLQGNMSTSDINDMYKYYLLPEEKEALENTLCTQLGMNQSELQWLITNLKSINTNQELKKALKKLMSSQ